MPKDSIIKSCQDKRDVNRELEVTNSVGPISPTELKEAKIPEIVFIEINQLIIDNFIGGNSVVFVKDLSPFVQKFISSRFGHSRILSAYEKNGWASVKYNNKDTVLGDHFVFISVSKTKDNCQTNFSIDWTLCTTEKPPLDDRFKDHFQNPHRPAISLDDHYRMYQSVIS